MLLLSEDDFKKFYQEVFPSVRTYIFAKCNDINIAEDMAQESFIRLWNNRIKVHPDKAKAFVFTVSNNLFLDHIRHQKVKNNHVSGFVLIQDHNDPQFLLEMEEFRVKLEATIQSIPQASREVFLLNRMEKMTYNQIAESLGLSVKAIEKRMQKALEIMAGLNVRK